MGIDRRQDTPFFALDTHIQRDRKADFAPNRTAPITGIQDLPVRCLVVNAEWMSLIAGQVERLAFHEVWQGSDDQREDAIQKIVEVLSMMGDCGLITDIRNSPTDTCIMQYSQDGGLTWMNGFDFTDCLEKTLKPLIDESAQSIIDGLLDKYDGTSASITKNLTYDGSGDDLYRDVALCNALQIFIDAMSEAELARRAQSIDIWEDIPDVLDNLALVAVGFAVPGAGWIALGLAIATVVIEVGLPLWGAMSDIQLNDETAREAVACQMYNKMLGQTPTYSLFQDSLNSHPFTFLSAEWNIAEATRPMIQELEIYLTFLQIWDDLYAIAKGGFIDVCDCPVIPWRVDWLNGLGQAPNTAMLSDTAHSNPNDWYFDVENAAGAAGAWIEIDMLSEFDIWEVRYQSELLNAGTTSQQIIRLYDDLHVLIDTYIINAGCWVNSGDNGCWTNDMITSGQPGGIMARYIQIHANVYQTTIDKESRITAITVLGSGAKPAGW